jgi:hypothetical protein
MKEIGKRTKELPENAQRKSNPDGKCRLIMSVTSGCFRQEQSTFVLYEI